jgi:hypothetical protein
MKNQDYLFIRLEREKQHIQNLAKIKELNILEKNKKRFSYQPERLNEKTPLGDAKV